MIARQCAQDPFGWPPVIARLFALMLCSPSGKISCPPWPCCGHGAMAGSVISRETKACPTVLSVGKPPMNRIRGGGFGAVEHRDR
jgi:hypothetical protein